MAYFVLKTQVSQTSYREVVKNVLKWAQARESRYVCAANVHVVMEAWDTPSFCNVVNHADMVTPDGMPLVWMLRAKGKREQERVYGPTLMLHVLKAAADEGLSVGFYGGDAKTLEKLIKRMQAKYPGLIVGFSCSPPFRALSSAEDGQIIQKINTSGVRILFVALGCPKQEKWMAAHRNKISAVMLGVGAAFDFHAGTIKQAPRWIQRLGLEWLFRFMQEPARLWKRYLFHNPRFVILALWELVKKNA